MGWTIGLLGFDSRRGLGIFLFTIASRYALGPTQPPNQWVPGALSLGVKRPGREADRSPPSSAEVKELSGAIPPLPNTHTWCGAQLKHRNNFTFTFYLYQFLCCMLFPSKFMSYIWVVSCKVRLYRTGKGNLLSDPCFLTVYHMKFKQLYRITWWAAINQKSNADTNSYFKRGNVHRVFPMMTVNYVMK
jgi:hypothetical protein